VLQSFLFPKSFCGSSLGSVGSKLAALALLVFTLFWVTSAAGGDRVKVASACPKKSAVFDGTYHRARFQLLDSCRVATGVVREVKPEEDGDLHIQLELDPGQEDLMNAQNIAKQRGRLVLELMPRDAGQILKPSCGWRVRVVGAWVEDGKKPSHGWNELHPIWKLTHGSKTFFSGPQFGGDPDGARSSNAKARCRTETGVPCPGYLPGSCGV
jgi:hypothetical protein